MVDSIRLVNFKCYADMRIPLAPLTVFSGMNAAGKSTVLQALNFLRQISDKKLDLSQARVPIEGDLISFGTVDDFVNSYAPRNENTLIEIEVSGDRAVDNGRLVLSRLPGEDAESRGKLMVRDGSLPREELLFGSEYSYLGADRISSCERFSYNDSEALGRLNLLGCRGEFSPWYLGTRMGMELPIREFKAPNSRADQLGLIQQVGFWMSCLGKDLQVRAETYDTLKAVDLRFAFVGRTGPGPWYQPRNVGFGLTHSLPIFVSLLSRLKGSLVLIENPESHLHPKAQVFMGEFVARAVGAGLQVILETHSDHVLNGIRLAVKQGLVSAEKVALNFLASAGEECNVELAKPKLFPSGAIDVWPKGFFDEYETVSLELL